ncbi:MAG: hypothetical protein ABIH99_02360, partial [Candidatus Micrarchaeota archaeon]
MAVLKANEKRNEEQKSGIDSKIVENQLWELVSKKQNFASSAERVGENKASSAEGFLKKMLFEVSAAQEATNKGNKSKTTEEALVSIEPARISKEQFDKEIIPALERYAEQPKKEGWASEFDWTKPIEEWGWMQRFKAYFEIIKAADVDSFGKPILGGMLGVRYEVNVPLDDVIGMLIKLPTDEGSYKAHEVLERKRGDCDDLSFLFIGGAKRLGLEETCLLTA